MTDCESDFSDPEIEEFQNLRIRDRPQGYKNSIVIRPIPSSFKGIQVTLIKSLSHFQILLLIALRENLDGAIVLLLGRIPAVRKIVQEWSRSKPPVSSRPRTSTWSCSASERDNLRSQRSSLPSNKGSPYRTFSISDTPSHSSESVEDRVSIRSDDDVRQRLGSASRGARLSVVAEDTINTVSSRNTVKEFSKMNSDKNFNHSNHVVIPVVELLPNIHISHH
ncbi:hypothetical protein GQR58_014352 [Nymphon striatum]|nr:hypothetical protein GQR58_014352 [Nymphon striatum]